MQTIVAEVKTHSPFGFRSDLSWDELFALAQKIGDIISIHTDPRWGGSFELLRRARARTEKPILAKGIHASDDHIREAVRSGADYVLSVGRIPDVYREKCWIEPLSLEDLKSIPTHLKAVWNSRDISRGGTKQETFAQARKIFGGWLCQASNIRTVADIEPGADAVLVGGNLASFGESLQK